MILKDGCHPSCPVGHVLRLDGKKKRNAESGRWRCDKCSELGKKNMEAWTFSKSCLSKITHFCRCFNRQVGTGLDGQCDYDICGPCMESMLVEGFVHLQENEED